MSTTSLIRMEGAGWAEGHENQEYGPTADGGFHRLYTGGEKVLVQTKKSSLFLIYIGGPPFLLVDRPRNRGPAIITNGYFIRVFSDKETWFGQTRVIQKSTQHAGNMMFISHRQQEFVAQYRFISAAVPTISSDWHDNPTMAYRECFNRRNGTKITSTGNGALIMGIVYPPLQEIIAQTYPEARAMLELAHRNSVPQRAGGRLQPKGHSFDRGSKSDCHTPDGELAAEEGSMSPLARPFPGDSSLIDIAVSTDDEFLTPDFGFPPTDPELDIDSLAQATHGSCEGTAFHVTDWDFEYGSCLSLGFED